MGCDIHILAERKTADGWEAFGEIFENPYYDPTRPTTVDDDGYVWNGKLIDQPYRGRNYDLFAILADVRNGRGFAGCDTGDGFIPICKPRGVPEDASRDYRALVESWDCDGHSHSWHTLADLLAYDWEQGTAHRGWVNLVEYREFREKGKPASWCGAAGGGLVRHISNDEMTALMDQEQADSHAYTQVQWSESYRDSVGAHWFKTMDRLQELAAEVGGPECVRIVFFFDN